MALSLVQAIAQVRDSLNEDVSVFWSDAEITQWLQEGSRDFSSKSLMVEDDDSITLVANQIIYTSGDAGFLADVLEPYAVLYNDGSNNYKGIIKGHPRMIGNEATNTAGATKYYSIHNRKLYIWPKPTAAMVTAGATLLMLYAKETDDITVLSDEYQHFPILYAKAMCLYKDRRFQEGNAMMALYSSYTNFERQDKHGREQETLDMFKVKPRGGERGAT
jgi:hypothetical protein